MILYFKTSHKNNANRKIALSEMNKRRERNELLYITSKHRQVI